MRTQYTNLPSLLKKEGLFCLWQYETRDGKNGNSKPNVAKLHYKPLSAECWI